MVGYVECESYRQGIHIDTENSIDSIGTEGKSKTGALRTLTRGARTLANNFASPPLAAIVRSLPDLRLDTSIPSYFPNLLLTAG